jgi:hypothetical protein
MNVRVDIDILRTDNPTLHRALAKMVSDQGLDINNISELTVDTECGYIQEPMKALQAIAKRAAADYKLHRQLEEWKAAAPPPQPEPPEPVDNSFAGKLKAAFKSNQDS